MEVAARLSVALHDRRAQGGMAGHEEGEGAPEEEAAQAEAFFEPEAVEGRREKEGEPAAPQENSATPKR